MALVKTWLIFVQRLRGLAAAIIFVSMSAAAGAQEPQLGPVSRQPLPRFQSLRSDRVNLREGPSKDHPTLWVFQRAGLPVEVTAEFEIWRKIRDSEGTEGWMLSTFLSKRRTALVAPKSKEPQVLTSSDHVTPVAKLAPGVIGNIKSCDGKWCRIAGQGFDGYMRQDSLWGVYPNEKID